MNRVLFAWAGMPWPGKFHARSLPPGAAFSSGAIPPSESFCIERDPGPGRHLARVPAADASITSQPGEINRLILLAAEGNGPAEKIKAPPLEIVARDDANDEGPRLPRIRACVTRRANVVQPWPA